MRNYDLSPLLRQWIGFDKLLTPCKPPVKAKPSRPITSKKATITITALPSR